MTHKLGIDLRAVGSIDKLTSSRKAGGISRLSTRSTLSVDNKQADAGRDCRSCLARPNSQGRTGTRIFFPCSTDHEQEWQPYSVDLLYVMAIHKHTSSYLAMKNENTQTMVFSFHPFQANHATVGSKSSAWSIRVLTFQSCSAIHPHASLVDGDEEPSRRQSIWHH